MAGSPHRPLEESSGNEILDRCAIEYLAEGDSPLVLRDGGLRVPVGQRYSPRHRLMIRLSLPTLVFVYAAVFLAGIFVIWVSYELVRKARTRRALRGRSSAPCAGWSLRMLPKPNCLAAPVAAA